MGFGGEGVFVDAHLVAVCCKPVPRRARRGAERALWDMARDEWWGKAAHTPFFGKSPRLESSSNGQPTDGEGGHVRSATPYNAGQGFHTGTGKKCRAELIVYDRGSKIKASARARDASHGPRVLLMESFVHRHLFSRNRFSLSVAFCVVSHSTPVAPTLFIPTLFTPLPDSQLISTNSLDNDLYQHRRLPPLRRACCQQRRCRHLHHQPCRRHRCCRWPSA